MKIVSNIDDLVGAWEDGQPLVFQVGFDAMPEVTWKASYRELKVRAGAPEPRTEPQGRRPAARLCPAGAPGTAPSAGFRSTG